MKVIFDQKHWLVLAVLPAITVTFAGCSAQSDETVVAAATAEGAPIATPAAPETTPLAPMALPPLPSEEPPAVEPIPEPDVLAQATPASETTNVNEPKGDTTSGDWPMWGGTLDRNMINKTMGVDSGFQPPSGSEEGKNVVWTSELGSQTYGNPVIAEGKVYVGTNNGGEYRPQHKGDRGVLLCFDEKDGKFLWQLTREKLPQGRVNDWPEQGICSTACVEDGKVYVVTNRAELMCLDSEGFLDGENDGPYTEEADSEQQDADVIWSLDLIEDLGVFPHNLATSSPLILDENIYVITSNGVDEAHLEIPAPRAPSFICVNKTTGELVWESNEPFDQILHGQWSSPAVGDVNGKKQVYFPGGDGWLYAFDPAGDGEGGGKIIWKFDMNPKDSKWELGGRGTRNNIISTPVFYENSVIIAVGQDPEHGEGVGHLYRIDATKEGDVSPQIADGEDAWKENPNSAQLWHHGGEDVDGSITGRKGSLLFRRTISTVGIADGLVIAPDLSGFMHCLDLETGKRYWEYDMFAACWGSPMIADGKIYIGDEDGELTVLPLAKELPAEKDLDVKEFDSSIYSTPSIANGHLYLTDRSRLYSFKIK